MNIDSPGAAFMNSLAAVDALSRGMDHSLPVTGMVCDYYRGCIFMAI